MGRTIDGVLFEDFSGLSLLHAHVHSERLFFAQLPSLLVVVLIKLKLLGLSDLFVVTRAEVVQKTQLLLILQSLDSWPNLRWVTRLGVHNGLLSLAPGTGSEVPFRRDS